MTIRHLKTFIKVAETESITKAAIELNIAQPSVTQTIKELEDYYNVELFSRIKKRLVITEEGKALLAKAREIVDNFNEFESLANDKMINPVIRMGATLTFGKRFVPNFIEILKDKYPDIDLFISMEKNKVLEEKLLKGEIDFALTEGLTSSKDIKATIIKRDRLVVVAKNDFKIKSSLTFKELTDYDLLLREIGSAERLQIDHIAASYGIKINPLIESISNYTIILSILKGIGIGILPYPLVRDYIINKQMKEIKVDCNLDRNLYIISLKGKTFTGLKKNVINICLKYIKEINEKQKDN